MEITFMERDYLRITDAKLMFRNFAGEVRSKYDKAGEGNFSVIIPDDKTANELMHRGWYVRVKPAREEGEEPLRTLKIKVGGKGKHPNFILVTNGIANEIDFENIGMLDKVNIISADIIVSPYRWTMDNGDSGITPYLQTIEITQALDPIMEKYYANRRHE